MLFRSDNKPSDDNKPEEKPSKNPTYKPQTGDLDFVSLIRAMVSSIGLGVLNRKRK